MTPFLEYHTECALVWHLCTQPLIRRCSQSYNCLPARGDASIPTTHAHLSRPYAMGQGAMQASPPYSTPLPPLRDGAGGDASIPTPHNPTPAPTRFYAVYRANPYEVGWSLEQAIGGKQPYKRLIGRIREIIHSTIWLNAGERARGRTLLQPRVASQLTAHASSR